MDRYAVFGHPIKHSRSPWIHARFAQQTGQQLVYTAEEIPLDAFDARVQSFFALGGKGLNVTVPFKEKAWALAEVRSVAAQMAGAVNTLYRNTEGKLVGDNTDGTGMLRDILSNHGGSIVGKDVLIVGAGGAVRGVLPGLLAESPARVSIVNRTVSRAQTLVDLFAAQGRLRALGFEQLSGSSFDLIINGTSAGLEGELPPLPGTIVHSNTWCYDMIYGRGDTRFQAWAQESGAIKALNGIGMLVEQAAEAFYLWRGVRPETGSIIAALRAELAGPI
ncbi:MAG: shikimate dehydrogenase [Pseudomonadota bacterium]